MPRLSDQVDEKDKPGILLRSLPEELGFLAIMPHTQNLEYDAICSILKLEADRKNKIQQQPTKTMPTSTAPSQPTNPMPAGRYADVPPPKLNSSNNRNISSDIECFYCGKKGHT